MAQTYDELLPKFQKAMRFINSHSCTDNVKVKALVADLNGIEHDLRTWDGKIAPIHVANWIRTALDDLEVKGG